MTADGTLVPGTAGGTVADAVGNGLGGARERRRRGNLHAAAW